MILVDAVFLVVAVLISALVWMLSSRRIAVTILAFSFLLVGLAQFNQNFAFAVVLGGVPIALRHSRKTRVVCAVVLLALQLSLLGPGFVTSRREVNGTAYQKQDHQTSYQKAYWEGVGAAYDFLGERIIPSALFYSLALAILILVPYRRKQEKSNETIDGIGEYIASPSLQKLGVMKE